MNWTIIFQPLISPPIMLTLGLVSIVLTLACLLTKANGAVLRGFLFTAVLFFLMNPQLRQEEREYLPDSVTIVVDQSESQKFGDRPDHIRETVATLTQNMAKRQSAEVQIVSVGSSDSQGSSQPGTRLLETTVRHLSNLPRAQMGAVILVTDGLIHDQELDAQLKAFDVPVHTILTGAKEAQDRRLIIEKAPRFGLVGKPLSLELRIDDFPTDAPGSRRMASFKVKVNGRMVITDLAVLGETHRFDFTLNTPGENIIEIETSPLDGELTTANNYAVIQTVGIHDRLRVLLVSGEPHAGERTWRNLLKSDPTVELVHFTILRPPNKQDGVPPSELALIAFPTRELFVEKLHEFDLVIFDRYRRRGVLPPTYLYNIAKYVENGGAVLMAVGPPFASPFSTYRTPLASILPGRPTGRVVEEPYKVRITSLGQRHPVTRDLPGANDDKAESEPTWGTWFRAIETSQLGGEMVMTGPDDIPLLLLGRIGEGRVAQLMTDHAWLWTRGHDGGGPQAELLRRLAHWLMKEPELEEERLTIKRDGQSFTVTRRSLDEIPHEALLTDPEGNTTTFDMNTVKPGTAEGGFTASLPGIYTVEQLGLKSFASYNLEDRLEYAELVPSDRFAKKLGKETGGKTHWAENGSLPAIRPVEPGRRYFGANWIGYRANNAYLTTRASSRPLLPPVLSLLLLVGLTALVWWREGN